MWRQFHIPLNLASPCVPTGHRDAKRFALNQVHAGGVYITAIKFDLNLSGIGPGLIFNNADITHLNSSIFADAGPS
jgi:hypothetical protein